MRIINVTVVNFGSYKDLTFDFHNNGLCLVYGPTGSGKSTLQDIVPWILFGATAKGGNVDEIRNWKSDEPTSGIIEVDFGAYNIKVTRIRGASKDNDLYYQFLNQSDDKLRGKDMTDTQKQINSAIGMDADKYSLSACFNEFSDAGSFFTAKAKERRQVFEKVTNLDFAKDLLESIIYKKRTTKEALSATIIEETRFKGQIEQLTALENSVRTKCVSWKTAHDESVKNFELKVKHFEKEKQHKIEELKTKSYRFVADNNKKINDLVDKLDSLDQKIKKSGPLEFRLQKAKEMLPPHCAACGRVNNTSAALEKIKTEIDTNNANIKKFSEYSEKIREIQKTENPYLNLIEIAEMADNHYDSQLNYLNTQINPFLDQISYIQDNLEVATQRLTKANVDRTDLENKLAALLRLNELSFDLRGLLLANVVKTIQNTTNSYLTKYFDSEFSVQFTLPDSDTLDVEILKNSYPCVYKQLSKGQRQILRLTFAVSLMQVAANNLGIHFDLLMFDEALDGLDSDLKVKAFGLFQDLNKSHKSVLVIDHTPEFQSLFDKRYKVSMVGDESIVEHE